MLDFSKFQPNPNGDGLIDPRQIFTTLKRHTRFKRPSDVQAEVLNKWFSQRPNRDATIKMNTGSGKTLVGLLALQSSLNEKIYPAVYVTPDKYLAKQVIDEAKDLGINVTTEPDDPAFRSGASILVINVYKLINGRSVFGVGAEGSKIPIGALVMDDAHACLETVADQFTITLDAKEDAYKELFPLFRDSLMAQSHMGLLDIETNHAHSIMEVPFWTWKDKISTIEAILHKHKNEKSLLFSLPLLQDLLPLCQCVVNAWKLEIAPRCLPIDQIPSFARAKRRIYMTATLADDGILVTHLQADPTTISKPIKPTGAGDMGDRMILAPQEISPAISDTEVRDIAALISKSHNVTVIVPSVARSAFWKGCAQQILDKDTIHDGVEKLKGGHVGLTVLVNKYDGIDLPDSACRLLIIDGLPEAYSLIERLEMAALDETETQLLKQIQRIEQGMGRGVRSSEDYCVVLLVGSRLVNRIHHPSARGKFTPATQAQIDLGRKVTDQVRNKSMAEILPLLNYCLDQDPNWRQASKTQLMYAQEGEESHIDSAVVHKRIAFDLARGRDFHSATVEAQKMAGTAKEPRVHGYFKQQVAEYLHHTNPASAQETLLSAYTLNRQVLKPLSGIIYSKLKTPIGGQAANAIDFAHRFQTPNDYVIFANALAEGLAWGEENSDTFEKSINDLGLLLGFGAQRPEKEIGKGPDNLWAIGNLQYFVIECKSGRISQEVSKSDCDQLSGSMNWFKTNYDSSCSATPVLVHPSTTFDRYSSPMVETRMIDKDNLAKLINAVRAFASSVAQDISTIDSLKFPALLHHYKLMGQDFAQAYTTSFRIKK